MEVIHFLFDFILHIDRHLADIIAQYEYWTYAILFIIIFCETGLVVTPFLPGDSLLFAAGALCVTTKMEVVPTFALISLAAILGNISNYYIGSKIGTKAFSDTNRILKKEYLDKTHAFFEKYGGNTIIITRFVPIVRTFAPFVAGVGAMSYGRFLVYNIIGGIAWAGIFIFAGYLFGNLPSVKNNFSIVVFAIIFISVLPMVFEWYKHKKAKKSK